VGIKRKEIQFLCTETWIDPPQPALKYIPDWYKKSHKYVGGGDFHIHEDGTPPVKDLKLCVPFLDSLTSGYIFCLWQDLYVSKNNDGSTNFYWEQEIPVISQRSLEVNRLLPRPEGHFANNFIWEVPLVARVPRGYSVIITHPFNRFDLPFTTLTGVVDADSLLTTGNYPFFLKESFEGVIPAGTPIMQIIPFRRDVWRSRINDDLEDLNDHVLGKFRSVISGYYHRYFWKKKIYK